MIVRNQLESIFRGSANRPKFLDFSPPVNYLQSGPISAREVAIEKGLESQDLGAILGVQGLPSYEVLKETILLLDNHKVLPPLGGIGIELGAGLALLSAVFIERDHSNSIQGIVALEPVMPFVRKGIEQTMKQLLKNSSSKILPCHGIFEQIPVPSETFDFALQIESLHHAEDLRIALREISRVVKPGGYLISIDRSWINSTSRKTLEDLLDHEYSKDWLITKNFPTDKIFTRRDNGEHEYRDKDWTEAFEESGFSIVSLVHLHPKIEKWHLIKRIVTILRMGRFLQVKVLSRKGLIRIYIFGRFWPNLRSSKTSKLLVSTHPRPLSVFILQRS